MRQLDDARFAGLSKEEEIALLAEEYAGTVPEMLEVAGIMAVAPRIAREAGMSEAKTWATLVVANAKVLGLDLDSPAGLGAAVMLTYYQMMRER